MPQRSAGRKQSSRVRGSAQEAPRCWATMLASHQALRFCGLPPPTRRSVAETSVCLLGFEGQRPRGPAPATGAYTHCGVRLAPPRRGCRSGCGSGLPKTAVAEIATVACPRFSIALGQQKDRAQKVKTKRCETMRNENCRSPRVYLRKCGCFLPAYAPVQKLPICFPFRETSACTAPEKEVLSSAMVCGVERTSKPAAK